METPLITYNLKQRGRQYRGADRNYDIPQLVKYINGNECQEKVKNRDLVGFYGHWARRKYGMNPNEGGIEDGKPFYIEPAIVTTYLKADNDGNVKHKAEFLKTDSGAVAEKLFNSRTGGFSSAIEGGRDGWFFYGFDYVLEPNYTNNRGYMLDDCENIDFSDPKQIERLIYNEQLRGVLYLLDNVEKQAGITNNIIENLRTENEDLLCKLANAEKELTIFKRNNKNATGIYYDGAENNKNKDGFMNVVLVADDRKQQFLDNIKQFNNTKNLPTFETHRQKINTTTSMIYF